MDDPRPLDLLHVFPSFEVGGSQRRTVTLMAELGPGFRHAVCSLSGASGARELVPADVPLQWVDAPPKGSSPRTARFLRGVLRARRPDLLLTYNWGSIDAVLARRTMGRRGPGHCHHEDGFGPDEANGPKRRRSLVRRLLLRRADRVIVPSRRLEELALSAWGVRPERLSRVPNGIDLERFRPGPDEAGWRARFGVPDGARTIGSVGSLRPEKNVARLVAALEALPEEPEVHLVIVGDGPERGPLEARARRSPRAARIHFAGPSADPAPLYRAFDVFALPSDTEQMPVALLEAMASGLAVASTDVGDVRTILPPAQGELLAPLSSADAGGEAGATALSERLARLLADPARAAALGRENRVRAEAELSLQRMVARYAELYRIAARGPAGRAGDGAGGPNRP